MNDKPNFIHLHVHSDFSLLESTASVMALADRAEELGMEYLALTDKGNMFGIMEFLDTCKETVVEHGSLPRKNPIKPIIGCEVNVTPGSRFEKKGSENENQFHHLVLLATKRQGYFNLVKLCSLAYTEGFHYRPRVDDELLSQYHEGLIALSGCINGEIPVLILQGKIKEAEQRACCYRDLFSKDDKGNPNYYLEIQDQGITKEWLKSSLSQQDINTAIADISKKTGIPLVATNDVHYIKPEDAAALDVLLCIGTGKHRTDNNRNKYFADQFYFKSTSEMAALFTEYPEAIANTVKIAERCVADVPIADGWQLVKHLPNFNIPHDFSDSAAYLRYLSSIGLAMRYPKDKEAGNSKWAGIVKRLDYELETIISRGFPDYFLIVADYVDWARKNNIPVGPGRGSGTGSIAAYVLRITNIDPIKYNLLFERFLNPERISLPDFDIDFGNEGREEVIKYVTEKYGKERVAQIIAFGMFNAKIAVKDAARVLDISISESDMITKLIPNDPLVTITKVIESEPKLKEIMQGPKYNELFTLACKLEGLHRHCGLHAAGIVIGKESLNSLVPLYKDRQTNSIATQYNMNCLERCCLIKFDFLGLKTLDVINNSVELIRRRGGEYDNFQIENIPEDDAATYKLFAEGNTFGIFLFESEGMQEILKKAKPKTIYDLIAINALYRPGAMDQLPRFISAKNGEESVYYLSPELEDVLKETYGIVVYQEQVMQIVNIIAGYTLGEADNFRRALGKKNPEITEKERERFIFCGVDRGHKKEKTRDIFELLNTCAGYCFNKCHSAAYALIAYQCAYLKANFSAEFMEVTLSCEPKS